MEKTGYIVPYTVFAGIIAAVSNGLYSTLTPTSSTAEWAGYQVLNGIGRGTGMQMVGNPCSSSAAPTQDDLLTPLKQLLAVQVALEASEIAMAMAMVVFAGMFGASITLSVSSTIFDQSLESELSKHLPVGDVGPIIQAGATGFRAFVGELPEVVQAYCTSTNRVFYLAAGIGALSVFTSMFMGWTDISKRGAKADEEQTSN